MRFRDLFEVHFTISTKVAIYSDDGTHVLVMKYGVGTHGLPGGHMEKGEHPDETLIRELKEELGIILPSFTRKDFFFRNSKQRSLILGYVSQVPANFDFQPPHPKKEHGVWMTRQELVACDTISDQYKNFVLNFWPHL